MTAERRIGKTTVIRILKAEPAPGWVPVFQDLEKCHTASEFAMAIYREVHQFLSRKGKVARRVRECLDALGGVEVGGLLTLPAKTEASWKDVLTRAIEDLVHENDSSRSRLLFLWDELPFMLANIRDREGERTAMEVLDTLRALRQTHPALRMIITGSIGLHHVVTSLKEKHFCRPSKPPARSMIASGCCGCCRSWSAITICSAAATGHSPSVSPSSAAGGKSIVVYEHVRR